MAKLCFNEREYFFREHPLRCIFELSTFFVCFNILFPWHMVPEIQTQGAQGSGIPEISGIVMGFFVSQGISSLGMSILHQGLSIFFKLIILMSYLLVKTLLLLFLLLLLLYYYYHYYYYCF